MLIKQKINKPPPYICVNKMCICDYMSKGKKCRSTYQVTNNSYMTERCAEGCKGEKREVEAKHQEENKTNSTQYFVITYKGKESEKE